MGWSGPMTDLHYRLWQEWLRQQWNEPTRTDHYLMQLAAEVRRPNVKDSGTVSLSHFKIKFEFKQVKAGGADTEQRTAFSKAAWFAGAGAKQKPKRPPDDPSQPLSL